MNLLSLLSFFMTVLYLYFGIYVFYLDRKNILNRLFLIVTVLFAIWSFGYTFLYAAQNKEEAWFWYRFSSFGWLPLVSFALHFALVFTHQKWITEKSLKKYVLCFLIYLPGFIFLIRSLTGVVFTKDFIIGGSFVKEVAAPEIFWFWAFLVYNSLTMTIFTVLVYRFMRSTLSLREKKQARIVFFTTVISMSFIYFFNILLIVLRGDFPVIGHMGFVIWTAGLWYAIVKYKMLSLSSQIASDQIVSQMMDLLFLLDNHLKVVKINNQAQKILGFSEEEIRSADIGVWVEEKEYFLKQLKEVLDSQKSKENIEVHLKTKYQEDIPVNISASPIVDILGEVLGIALVGHDIREKIELARKNAILEKELQLAKEIQLKLLPPRVPEFPNCRFSVIYQPMIQVGGDFYDFIKVREPYVIGIFISDVSGHGVAAALITSMLKTLIETSGKYRLLPSEFLSYVNDKLYGLTGGNFLTAFYGIFDAKNYSFTYARAAHTYPLLIRNNQIIPLKTQGGVLAIIKDRVFEKQTIELLPGDRLFFYTDGITEARNKTGEEFESLFYRKLAEYASYSVEKIVQSLYKDLVEFHGDSSFEDDICLLGMEIDTHPLILD